MAETQNNVAMLNRKEWQTMTPAPITTATGTFTVEGNRNNDRFVMFFASTTVHFLYCKQNDDWVQIASGAFSPTIAAGTCGCYTDWSGTFTANGGSTTTITVNRATHNLNGFVVGRTVEMLSGTANNVGLRRTITAIMHPAIATGTITLTLDTALPSAVANNDTFRVDSGRFWVCMGGTLVAASFQVYDVAAGTWTQRSITGLPAAPGTDCRMVTPGMVGVSYDTGTADADSSTTALEDDAKSWTADQWINYQVRITAGTGIGQIRVITDNDTDTLTIAAGTDLDDTSVYAIEGDENAIYYLGNNAVTMYKYSISGNSWSTVAPTTARTGAPGIGMTADFVGVTGDAGWADITAIKDGRYIYSFRGAAGALLDRFDISGGTAGAGAWEVVVYHPYITTFTTGTGSDWSGQYIYIGKEGSATVPQRFYAFDVVGNSLCPVATDWYLAAAAVLGNKMFIGHLSSAGTVKWLYNLQSGSTNLRRIMLF